MIQTEVPITVPSFQFGNSSCCAYCGDAAPSRDHVIAVSYQKDRRCCRFSSNGPWCWACTWCNTHLSNRYFDTFKERCEWVRWRLEQKAEPIEWHNRELERLDYTIKSYVLADVLKRKWWRQRADFYGSRDFYLNLESLTWEISSIKNEGAGGKFIAQYFSSMLRNIKELYRPSL